MLSLRNRFGIPGVISVIALVFAMLGGAYAASNDGGSATASAKKKNKAKKGPRGPRGFKGKPGSPGPAGAPGAEGPAGPQGPAGANGTNGANGASGNTVLSGSGVPPASLGSAGDFYIDTAASRIYGPKGAGWGSGTSIKGSPGVPGTPGTPGSSVLNGSGAPTTQGEDGDFYLDTDTATIYGPKAGAAWGSGTSLKGPEGNIKETLPPGITLKGTWSVGQVNALAAAEPLFVDISFGIPHGSSFPTTVQYMKEGENVNKGPISLCEGGTENPTVSAVASGRATLCIFAAKEQNWTVPNTTPTSTNIKAGHNVTPDKRAGAVLQGETAAAGPAYGYGTWALEIAP